MVCQCARRTSILLVSVITVCALAVCGLSTTSTSSQQQHPELKDALQLFVNTTGCKRPTPYATCDPVLDAFALEASAVGIPAIGRTNHAVTMRRWYDAVQRGEPVGDMVGSVKLTTKPEQIHLSMTGIEGNVTVLWTTSTKSSGSQACWWPEGNTTATVCAMGSSWTYDPVSIIPWTGNIHGASITNLMPGARYCYAVGDPTLNTTSEDVCFTAPRLAMTSPEDELLLAIGGDMGTVQLVGYKMAAQMRADELAHDLKFDAFWHLGDIAYSTLDPPKDNFEFFWDMYLQQEQSFINHVPLLTTFGNHDFGGGDSAAFLNRFRNPVTGDSGSPYYWSYDHGPIRYVSMCTEPGLVPRECDYAPGSAQYKWIESRFASINRTKTPWLIFVGHRPMYSSDKSVDSGPLREYIEPLLVKYKVDLEMAGHMHETEVVAPVKNHTANMTGVTKLSSSDFAFHNAGAPAHLTMGTLGAVIDEKWVTPSPEWSLFHKGTLLDDAYGYVQLRANATQLAFQFKRQKDNATMWSLLMTKD